MAKPAPGKKKKAQPAAPAKRPSGAHAPAPKMPARRARAPAKRQRAPAKARPAPAPGKTKPPKPAPTKTQAVATKRARVARTPKQSRAKSNGRSPAKKAKPQARTKQARRTVSRPKKPAPSGPPHRPIAAAPAVWEPNGPAAALAAADPTLGEIIRRVGPPSLTVEADVPIYRALARSIIYQQLNGKAAATILGRVQALGAHGFPQPAEVLALPDDQLRGAGLSANKLRALRDLARRHLDGSLPADAAARALPDDALVDALTQVRGIGRWTVEMLLMFYLGRTDVLPATDYGVRHGFFRVYGGDGLPAPAALLAHGARWAPHRTLASWYLWRAVELP